MKQHYLDSVRALPLEDQENQFFDPVAVDWISQDPVFIGSQLWEGSSIDGLMMQARRDSNNFFKHLLT